MLTSSYNIHKQKKKSLTITTPQRRTLTPGSLRSRGEDALIRTVFYRPSPQRLPGGKVDLVVNSLHEEIAASGALDMVVLGLTIALLVGCFPPRFLPQRVLIDEPYVPPIEAFPERFDEKKAQFVVRAGHASE